VPLPPLERKAARFIALYPIAAGQFAINDGRSICNSGAHDGDVLAWLLIHLTENSKDVLVLDADTQRVWRASYSAAIEFMVRVNPSAS
jgi:hypothetical protein